MSGSLGGVQRKVQEMVGSNCIYVHCYAHRLNLVVVSAASCIEEASNFFGLLEAVYSFIIASTLRHKILWKFPNLVTQDGYHYAVFKERYSCILNAMQAIVDDPHDGREWAECVGLLVQLKSFSFVMLLWVFDHILGITKVLSDLLQWQWIS